MELKLLGERHFGGGTATTHPNLPKMPNETEGIEPAPRWVEQELSYAIVGAFSGYTTLLALAIWSRFMPGLWRWRFD
jgi:hypothetical protein